MAFILVIILALFANSSEAQVGTAVRVPTYSSYGMPMWLQLPANYRTTRKYLLIVFFHGLGESSTYAWNDNYYMNGNDLAKVYTNAQSLPYFRENGWNGAAYDFKRSITDTFIIISPQQGSSGWSRSTDVYYFLNYMKNNYSIDTNRIYMTGLSAGGRTTVNYAEGAASTDQPVSGSQRPYIPAAIVPMSEAGGNPIQAEANAIVADSIRAWGFGDPVGDAHGGKTQDLITYMNVAKAGFGRFTSYSGGHCCWGTFYTPTYKEKIGSDSMNIYSWMLQFSRGTDSVGMTANAGTDQNLSAGTTSTTLSGSGTPSTGHSITGYGWSQISGTSATIVSPTSASTSITGLTAGARTLD